MGLQLIALFCASIEVTKVSFVHRHSIFFQINAPSLKHPPKPLPFLFLILFFLSIQNGFW